MFFKKIIFAFSLITSLSLQAQEETFLNELMEYHSDHLPEGDNYIDWIERMANFKKHPINLNKTNREELNSLFFLSPLQIGNLFTHISIHGPLVDVLELQAIPGFDNSTIQKLLAYVTIKEDRNATPLHLKSLLKQGESSLILRYDRIVEKQKDYQNTSVSRYLGSPDRILMRYTYQFFNRLSFGLIMEKDAGEKLTFPKPDFVSANLHISGNGVFRKVIIGDYRLQFGQGLNLWSGFSFGKSPEIAGIVKKENGLQPYSSANEYAFFRGISMRLNLTKTLSIYPFWSLRKHDASLSLENGKEVLIALNETGYHRTASEQSHANTVMQQVYGVAFNHVSKDLNIGLNAFRMQFDKTFLTGQQPYQRFNFTGRNLNNFGIYYSHTYKNAYLYGEMAKSTPGGIALLNGLLISLSDKISASVLYRNYQKDYHNFFSQPPAESSYCNEKGWYMALHFTPQKSWELSLYNDSFSFPWLKFRVDAPSTGSEQVVKFRYVPSKRLQFQLRASIKHKEENSNEGSAPIQYIEPVVKKLYQLDMDWKINLNWSWQGRIAISTYRKGFYPKERGYLIFQDLLFKPAVTRISGNMRLAYFNSHSYNSRLYAYENDVLYHFGLGLYNGRGFRTYINFRIRVFRKTNLWLRYARFYYINENPAGIGLDEISKPDKSEVKVQIRYQF